LSSIGILAIAISSAVLAQDTRTVVEPKIPAFCVTLEAHLTAINDGKFNTLAPADESKPDTDRIQKAIDHCAKGKGVALVTHAAANAFLSGPLQLREGVTLVVNKGVTLFETLDPAAMEASPGSCGIVATTPGRGCKPLISVDNVSGAGVMGDGVIDGRRQPRRQLHSLPHHAEELAQLPRLLQRRQRLHRLGRQDRYSAAPGPQYRRHRSRRGVEEHYHHPQLPPRRGRQRRH
jgi:hypothetical protein